jgi:para-nitrobenzyl esterase
MCAAVYLLSAGAVPFESETGPARLAAQSGCFVSTGSGDVQGQDLGASCAFLGIPYAASPAGSNRWKPPQAAVPWTTLLQATAIPSGCPSINAGTPGGNEDCLKLNIWVAKSTIGRRMPVIVWLHTGSFVAASANFASHNGKRLAEETGAIVVAPNYRLGPFGFLVHAALDAEDPGHPSSGNYGLMDQRAALQWVQDNIASFGGDAQRVTLAGTSAGADSVGLHMVSPASARLFQRAIIESGTPTIRWPTHDEGLSRGDAVAAALGCTDPASVLSCMRSKPSAAVLQALPLGSQQPLELTNRAFWLPVVDGIEIPDQPRWLFASGLFNHVPTILGTNRDEGWGFVLRSFPSGADVMQYEDWIDTEFGADAALLRALYPASAFVSPTEAMSQMIGDAQFVCETRRLSRLLERAGTPAFLYSYEYEIDALSVDHVIHGVESNIIFGNGYAPMQFPLHPLDATDTALHSAMEGYWTRFAGAGTPNTDDPTVVHWPAFKHPTGPGRGADKYLKFDVTIAERLRLREAQCDRVEPLFLRTLLGEVPASAP